jgi:uncharacterized membrane protein
MNDVPPPTRYHRLMGWHAPAIRRVAVAAAVGLVVTVALAFFVGWPYAVIGGWDTIALIYLVAIWPLILRANGAKTKDLATQEDDTRAIALLLLVGASLASLLTVGFALHLAGQESSGWRVFVIGMAVLTLMLSWIVVNTLFTLRYADLHYHTPPGIDFGDDEDEPPNFRDFAYVAFTIGMTYQVSDTTLRRSVIRRTVLLHALLSYLFGVVIVATTISLIADLLRR